MSCTLVQLSLNGIQAPGLPFGRIAEMARDCGCSQAWKNYRRAKKTVEESNLTGEGLIAGGLLVLRRGNGGVVLSHVEKTFGDHAPMAEVRRRGSVLQTRVSHGTSGMFVAATGTSPLLNALQRTLAETPCRDRRLVAIRLSHVYVLLIRSCLRRKRLLESKLRIEIAL